MFYSVRDITILEYDEPVREHVVEIRKKPRDDERQRCLHYDLELSHDARLYHYTDYLGNVVDHFDVPQALKELTIEAQAMVELLQLPYVLLESEWDEVDAMLEAFGGHEMLLTSPGIPDTVELREFETSLGLGASEGPLEYVLRLSKAIHDRFEVGENGDLRAALKNGRTCSRIFAHMMIGLSRRAGLPARVCRGVKALVPQRRITIAIEVAVDTAGVGLRHVGGDRVDAGVARPQQIVGQFVSEQLDAVKVGSADSGAVGGLGG